VSLAEDQYPVGDLGPGGEHEPFGIGVRAGFGHPHGPEPDLSVVTYRYLPKKGDANGFNRRLLDAVLASGRAAISATEVNGNYTLRLAVMHYRTHLNHVDELIDLLAIEAARLETT
jgi:aromatic-L-amino-acid decarboxylase